MAGIRDGNVTLLYIDGELVGTNTGPLATIHQADTYFGFGARQEGGSWGFPFTGQLAEARLWNNARSAEDIKKNRHYLLTGEEAGLIGYWPMDEGQGSLVKDLTASGYHCTGPGDIWVFTETFRRVQPPMDTVFIVR